MTIFQNLQKATRRPKPFEYYTAADLWTDKHIAEQMLTYHLDDSVDLASRNHAFIDRSVAWLVSRFEIGAGTAICDFGCGPGLYATRLAERGAEVTGIDFSENSIAYAQRTASEKGLAIDYRHQNYLTYEPDRQFDLIIMIFCDYCPLSPEQRMRLLSIFNRALKPDGWLVLDLCSTVMFDGTEEKNEFEVHETGGFWSPDPHVILKSAFTYEQEELILHKATIIEEKRIREIYNWLQCFTLESLGDEFQAGGFRIIERYANVAGDPYDEHGAEFAVVAQKS
jgi:SAM-dependent methyltransferase